MKFILLNLYPLKIIINKQLVILLFGDFLGKKHPELLRERMPLCLKNTGGSLWLRKK